MRTLIAIAATFAVSGCVVVSETHVPAAAASYDKAKEISDIKEVLSAQEAAWNRGDIDGFMEGYWKAEDLRFASGGHITHGWQATIDRYKRNYDSPAKMGTLTFNVLEYHLFSPTHAMVFGEWKLEREGPNPNGLYTLILHKIDGEWLIVSDHTSAGEAEEH